MNPRNRLKVLTALCLGSLGLAAFGQMSPATVPSPAKAAPSTQAMIHYGQLPLSFEPNHGQTSSNVQWLARGAGIHALSLGQRCPTGDEQDRPRQEWRGQLPGYEGSEVQH